MAHWFSIGATGEAPAVVSARLATPRTALWAVLVEGMWKYEIGFL
jgi:hypothetical protein